MVDHPPERCYVLEGRVVTMGPEGVLERGAIYVDDGVIEAVQSAGDPVPDEKYRAARRVNTGGTIYPGLIELHNHLAYNAIPLWSVPKRYTNNGQWRGIEPYTARITKPSQVLGQTPGAAEALVRYSECRALLGGTTTTQGITLASAGGITKYYRGLVRNAEDPDHPDLARAGTNIANPTNGGAAKYRDTLDQHRCYLQHLSEGTDDTARGWFQRLQIDDDTWAVTRALGAIHGTALKPEDFEILAAANASMVWSPLSNYLLYGATTDVAAAKTAGVRLCLGADWSPSGSKNLLGELKVAWLASRELGDVFTDRELVEAVTVNPAIALGWEGRLGTIAPGRLADLVVIDGRSDDPYRALIEARETSVTLVVIGGVPRIGQERLMQRFWDDPLDGQPWIDRIRIGRSHRTLYLEHDDDLLDGLPLSRAITELSDAMARLPELAERVDDAIAIAGGNAGDTVTVGGIEEHGTTFRVVPDFEEEDTEIVRHALGFALAAQPYSYWVTDAIDLDPITAVDDRRHVRSLVAAANLPEFIKKELPALLGHPISLPDSAGFLDSAGSAVDPQLVATTTDLRTLLSAFGELTLDDRKRIVDQALVLLVDNYVHLPLKRAMYAVDPVQRLRLLRQRLDETTPEAMPPEMEFHTEITDIFNSLRDLHTGYRLPRPFGDKVAWLPFLVEQIHHHGETAYILAKWVAGAWPDPEMQGARVTHWNGMPIATAVARNGERHVGGNPAARHAHGLNRLTVRPIARGLPPDEEWVTIRWVDEDGDTHDHTETWLVFAPGATVGPGALTAESAAVGIDDHGDDIQQARKVLYAPQVAMAERTGDGQFLDAPLGDAAAGLESHMPGVFRAMEVRRSDTASDDPAFGYIRIFTFNVPAAEPFVDEFLRLARLLPDTGLVIDVRGNAGGLIFAAEELLQVLTPQQIEPEPAQFVNTPLNLRISRRHRPSTSVPGLSLDPWVTSMEDAIRTGATYSHGFPITSAQNANRLGQRYHGPVVLVADGLSYSATDMFAAGFQDHGIGTVVGVGGATGAGGANVWSHAFLRRLAEPTDADARPSPYEALPSGADLRVAIRRTTRVRTNAGNVLEDIGVVPDQVHQMTRADVMEGNRDLIDTAIAALAAGQRHSIAISAVRRHRDRAPSVTIRTVNVDRIDARVNGRWLRTRDVRRGRATLDFAEVLRFGTGPEIDLDVQGYAGEALVAALRDKVLT